MMPASKRSDGAPWRNLYGRRHGKTLRKGQVEHLENTLPKLMPKGVSWEDNPKREPLDLQVLFGEKCPLWLEVGFGNGEHLLHMARLYPKVGFIGCEPYVNGVATLVPKIAESGLQNIRVHPGDARDLLDVIPAGTVEKCFLLYPDPWPKTRHHERRFMNKDQIDQLANAMSPGAEFRLATDIPDYVRHSLELMQARTDFHWMANSATDWRHPWSDWTRTRYEAKAIREGRKGHYLTFTRCKEI